MQTSLFQTSNTTFQKMDVSGNAFGVNPLEAPEGFFAVHKKEAKTHNVCNSCDAKKLCQADQNDWCLKNRCMAQEITAFKDGKTYKRHDGQTVFFKRLNVQHS